MASFEITSNVFKIDSDANSVYALLSDFNKMGVLVNMTKQMDTSEMMPTLGKLADNIESVTFTSDSVHLIIKGIGELSIQIVEREEPKLIKLVNTGKLPMNLTVWIQLLSNGPYDTRLRMTVHVQMNSMLKMLLKGKMEKIINTVAEGLTKIPYSILNNLTNV
ncbi:hypothetical protein FACS1894195_1210 [Bacteroidia bacterium]|nr:hypothetical protein FACS1894195_1210 [Bacteroidia bacterium]